MKRIVAFLLMFALVCSLGISTTGCSKNDKKTTTPPADTKKDKDDKKP